ncbi:MAG: GNAT family N-acetyltransferase [Christensenellales bacterium]|jgi:ribosomal protein S18 acetylase RimI-like enzyme
MDQIIIKQYGQYDQMEILELYKSVGWTNYSSRPEMLKLAYENSLLVLGAYFKGRLVGVIRLVGDGHSIVYIQDIIVLPQYQRRGIGSSLLRRALEHFPDVYQTVLLTDAGTATEGFYKSLGFASSIQMGCVAFVKFRS